MHERDDSQGSRPQYQLVLLCVLLSLLLHGTGAWLLLLLPAPQSEKQARDQRPSRVLHIRKGEKKAKMPSSPQKEQTNPQIPFAKTDADHPETRPRQTDFQGKRHSRAEGMSDGSQRSDDTPVPTMDGEEAEEINTLERERQDGPIEHEGPDSPLPVPPPTPEPTPGQSDTPSSPQPDLGTEISSQPPTDATPSILPPPENRNGDTPLHPDAPKLTPAEPPAQTAAPQSGQPDARGTAPVSPRPRVTRPVYDPSLADHAQPGFRTTERRSRSTGRFILGRHPSLNVSATPMGRYEELIYRLIARRWYAACDEHRGDIIPGSIIIAFRLNKRGSVETMNLVTRRGASVIQQSFTFGAIRRAQLPPMPPAVQQELIGEQLELIFTFYFD